MKYIILIALLLMAPLCHAVVYVESDKNAVTYTDVPTTGNEQIVAPDKIDDDGVDVSTPPAPSAVQAPAVPGILGEADAAQVKPYTKFEITSPLDGATIQNQPAFAVSLLVEPELNKGDMIQLYVDGVPWGAPVLTPTIEVTQMERGEHKLHAELLNQQKSVIKTSQSVTVFNHRANLNSSPALNAGGGN